MENEMRYNIASLKVHIFLNIFILRCHFVSMLKVQDVLLLVQKYNLV